MWANWFELYLDVNPEGMLTCSRFNKWTEYEVSEAEYIISKHFYCSFVIYNNKMGLTKRGGGGGGGGA